MRASDTYRHPDFLHNCSQALAFKFASLYPDPDNVLQRFASTGAGRAPGGMCGALYAAIQAFPDAKDVIVSRFAESTSGCTTCRDIKSIAAVPCKRCIDIAEDIIADLASAPSSSK